MNTQIDPKEGSIRVKTYPQSLQGHMHNARQSLDIDIRASSLTGCSCMDLLFVSSHYRLWLDNPPLPSHVPPPPRACERAAVTTEAVNLTPSRTSLSTTCCHSPANSSQPSLPTQPPPSPPLHNSIYTERKRTSLSCVRRAGSPKRQQISSNVMSVRTLVKELPWSSAHATIRLEVLSTRVRIKSLPLRDLGNGRSMLQCVNG